MLGGPADDPAFGCLHDRCEASWKEKESEEDEDARGEGADWQGVGVGDEVSLPTPAGVESFRVEAVVAADYSGDQGSVILDRVRFAALWQDTLISHFNVFLKPGANLEDVRTAAVRTLGRDYMVKVLTVPQTLAYHQGMVDRAFVFTYAIQLLVVAVTLAGIFDLLTTQVIERRREVGVFRALGADKSHIARAIRLEAVAIGVVGDPTAPGNRKGGAVSRKRLRRRAFSHAFNSLRYHSSPRWMPSLKMQPQSISKPSRPIRSSTT